VNAYWIGALINTGTCLTPIGVGLGLGFISTKGKLRGSIGTIPLGSNTGSDTGENFAWDFSLGLSLGYNVIGSLTLDEGYRFAGLGFVEMKAEHLSVGDIPL